MSTIAAVIAPAGGVGHIAVDTDAVDLQGGHRQVSKVLALPHANALLAGRGEYLHLLSVFGTCATLGASVDVLAERMGEALALARASISSAWAAEKLPPEALYANGEPCTVLMGWSPTQRRIVGWVWGGYTKDPLDMRRELEPAYYGPGRLEAGPHPLSPLEFERAARAQVQRLKEEHGANCPAGGRLIIASVTERGVELRNFADLEERQCP